jgi:hypothetical protein
MRNHGRNAGTGPRTVEMILSTLIGDTTVAGCWPWLGKRDHKDYGRIRVGAVSYPAHRFVFEAFGTAVPSELVLDHLCRNHWCVNPDHLEVVTGRENALRGIGPTAINARKTHCIRGHEFTPENTARNTDGARVCRECTRMRGRARRALPTSLAADDPRHGTRRGYSARCRCQPCRDAWAAYRRSQRPAA